MNSATPIATGTAIMSAMAAASSVPKTSGQTYGRKLSPLLTSSGEAVMPGMPCTVEEDRHPGQDREDDQPGAE